VAYKEFSPTTTQRAMARLLHESVRVRDVGSAAAGVPLALLSFLPSSNVRLGPASPIAAGQRLVRNRPDPQVFQTCTAFLQLQAPSPALPAAASGHVPAPTPVASSQSFRETTTHGAGSASVQGNRSTAPQLRGGQGLGGTRVPWRGTRKGVACSCNGLLEGSGSKLINDRVIAGPARRSQSSQIDRGATFP
jgi:hypothetical protein